MLCDIYSGADLIAVVLGKSQAESLAAQLTADYPHCETFIVIERDLNKPFTHWVNASFCD
jgi:hypothetical protein